VSIDIKGGIDPRILNSGAAWHIPGTADPVQAAKYNKNFTLGAHRYAYRPPSKNTFYNLDKVAVGDIVQVYWDGQEYNYQVDEVKVVEPEDVEILEPGDENKITLFTCTPLFTSKQRLVVTGRPIN